MIVPATRGDNPKTFCGGRAASEPAEDGSASVKVADDDCDSLSTSSKLSSSAGDEAEDDVVAEAGGSSHVAMPTTPMIVMIKKTTAALQLADRVTCHAQILAHVMGDDE
jgi:hypothetical protein